MPSSLLNADINFPRLSKKQPLQDQIDQITSYLYMLLEQLRWSLAHMDKGNFSESGLTELEKLITDPVYMQLSNAEGEIASLSITAQGLISRVSDAEGNISSLVQTANSLQLGVSNGVSSSTISLLANGIVLSSKEISFSGMVTFTDLSTSGRTTINGGNITTGSITAIDIDSCNLGTLLSSGGSIGGQLRMYYMSKAADRIAGGIRLDDQGTGSATDARYRMYIYTNSIAPAYGGLDFAIKIKSAGALSIESGDLIYIDTKDYCTIHAPDPDGVINLQAERINLIGDVYVNGSPI